MIINFSKLSGRQLEIAKNISKQNGAVYKTKPKNANGYEKYVWRLVSFLLSSHGPLTCWPVSAEFDLYDYIEETENVVLFDEQRKTGKGITAYDFIRKNKEYNDELKATINTIVDSIENNKRLFNRNPWIDLV